MAQLTSDCPRCRHSRVGFNALAQSHVDTSFGWQRYFELFCVCRNCGKATIFVVAQRDSQIQDPVKFDSVNDGYEVRRFVAVSDMIDNAAPEHLSPELAAVFREGAVCKSVKCFNAAGTMFRLCVDLATRPLLPPEGEEAQGLNAKVRRDLGLRLPWLFSSQRLPADLKSLSDCIREDGNDGAHQGTLTENEAEDLQDFAAALLSRMFTEPERLRLAEERRKERRKKPE